MNNLNKHIWEGWTVGDFIDELSFLYQYAEFKNANDIKQWCKSNQPYYKKHIPEVYKHFLMLAKQQGKFKD
jgi:hypothetical protein